MTLGQVIGGSQSMIRRNLLGLETYRPTFQEGVIHSTILSKGMGVQPGYMDPFQGSRKGFQRNFFRSLSYLVF